MKTLPTQSGERGVALVASLIFLLIITVMSVVAATNSKQGLSMASNLQDGYDSFQAAEAGVMAAIGAAGTANDVFTQQTELKDVFSTLPAENHPLKHINDGASTVPVDVIMTRAKAGCPRKLATGDGFFCDYYRVDARHHVPRKATTDVSQGVVRAILPSG